MMTTIKTSLSKVLTLAVVALTVLFSFAVNPAVAQPLGYCCDLNLGLQNRFNNECQVRSDSDLKFLQAELHNDSPTSATVINKFLKQEIVIPSDQKRLVPLLPNSSFVLDAGTGPVKFNCRY